MALLGLLIKDGTINGSTVSPKSKETQERFISMFYRHKKENKKEEETNARRWIEVRH
jgi:hypothetical protein